MKISNSQLQDIRRLYKKFVTKKKVQAAEFQETLASKATQSTETAAAKTASNVPGTNYNELHQAIERRKLEVAAKAVAEAPDVRQEKIDAIQAQIDAGTYHVEPEAIAERLLASGLFDEFLG